MRENQLFLKRFIRTLKTKNYKYMTSVSKNVYIDKLDDIVGEYDNTYHGKIKMKLADVKNNTYIDFEKEINDKYSKFKVGDNVRISKYKNILLKDTHQPSLKKFSLLVKLKIQFHRHMLLMTLMVKKLLEYVMKKNYKRLIKKNLGLKR